MMRRLLAVVVLLPLLATACAAGESSVQGTWRLVEMQGQGPLGDSTVTATFEDGRVHGSGGCNRYTGEATVDGDRLRVGPLASTMMACAEAVMAQESAYLQALEATARWEVAEGRLQVRDTSGTVVLVFDAAE